MQLGNLELHKFAWINAQIFQKVHILCSSARYVWT